MGIIIISIIMCVVGILLVKVKNPLWDSWDECVIGQVFAWCGGIVGGIAGFVLFMQTMSFPSEEGSFLQRRETILASMDNETMTEAERAETLSRIHTYNMAIHDAKTYKSNWFIGAYYNPCLLDSTIHTPIDVNDVPSVKYNLLIQHPNDGTVVPVQ